MMSLLKTIETISKLPSVKFCIPATNQHQHIRIVQNNAPKAVSGGKQNKEGASITQLVSRAEVETQIRHYHAMTGLQIFDIPPSQGYILPVRSTVPSFMSKQSKDGKDKCRHKNKKENPCKMRNCKLKKPKKKKEHECDPDEPEDMCKKDNPCNWYPGKRPC